MKKKVILNSVAEAFRNNKAIVVENLSISEPKTSSAVEILSNIKAEGKVCVVFDREDNNADMSFRNIAGINLAMPDKLNVINLLSSNNIVITEKSLVKIAEIFNK